MKYVHAYDFVFDVVAEIEAKEVTPTQLRAAILDIVTSVSDEHILEACGLLETYEIH